MAYRNKFILLFLTFMLFTKGQTNYAWFPVKPNIQYNYTIDSSTSPIAVVIQIDSISVNSLTWYNLNKIITSCDTCNNHHLVNDYYDSTYSLNKQPQFLEHVFSNISDTIFYFKGNHSFVIRPFTQIGLQWLYDTISNVSAQILSRTGAIVLGNTDSICTIKLSTGDTLILSKDHGIVQFPVNTSAHHKYNLVGLEGVLTAGIQLKRFHDFFDFNVGDVFQFSFSNTDANLYPPMFQNGHERWDILSAQIYPDSSCYSIKQTYFDSLKYGNSQPTITSYSTVSTLTFIDSTKHLANLFPLQEIMVNSFYIINNGVKAIHKVNYNFNSNLKIEKSFGENCPNIILSTGNTGAAETTSFPDVYLNRNRTKVVGRRLTEGLGFTSELFNDYDRIYERCMIGYIKGNDTSGVILEGDPLMVKENELQNKFRIYPVPANNTIYIDGKSDGITNIQLTNLLGEKCAEFHNLQEKTFIIDVSMLANGIYFIIMSKQNYTETQKLIIQHRYGF